MSAFVFPLIPSQQQMQVTLANTLYTLNFYFNSNQYANCWMLDILDSDGNLIVGGIPLVTGTDLTGQFPYLNFGGQLVVQTTSNTDAVPTYTNLGSDGNLYFVTTP